MDKNCELRGHRIPAGILTNIGVFTLHNSPKYYKYRTTPRDSILSDFQPEMIGQTFAEFEFKVLMSRFLKLFKLKLVPGQDLNYEEPKTTLSPKDKIRCTLTLQLLLLTEYC